VTTGPVLEAWSCCCHANAPGGPPPSEGPCQPVSSSDLGHHLSGRFVRAEIEAAECVVSIRRLYRLSVVLMSSSLLASEHHLPLLLILVKTSSCPFRSRPVVGHSLLLEVCRPLLLSCLEPPSVAACPLAPLCSVEYWTSSHPPERVAMRRLLSWASSAADSSSQDLEAVCASLAQLCSCSRVSTVMWLCVAASMLVPCSAHLDPEEASNIPIAILF
jgi:hypothetical protein